LRCPIRHPSPTVGLYLDRETFVRLVGGHGVVDTAAVTITGDVALAEKLIANLAVTP